MVHLTITGPYTAKDQLKANTATKFIGRGSTASSTNIYRKDFGVLANCGEYTKSDKVFISAEGNRACRLSPDFEEIRKAINANATLITDNKYNRNRSYNIGEREVANFIHMFNYKETSPGVWMPKLDDIEYYYNGIRDCPDDVEYYYNSVQVTREQFIDGNPAVKAIVERGDA